MSVGRWREGQQDQLLMPNPAFHFDSGALSLLEATELGAIIDHTQQSVTGNDTFRAVTAGIPVIKCDFVTTRKKGVYC